MIFPEIKIKKKNLFLFIASPISLPLLPLGSLSFIKSIFPSVASNYFHFPP